MYISLNWLKDYVNIPRSMTAEELGEKLTAHTVEIDAVIAEADKFKNIAVGEILAIKKHPQADKLQIADVDIGGKKNTIVCGANNIEPGQKVPVALPGSCLPNGTEIFEVKIRQVKSEGMLCAEDELGLGEDHSGILILDKKAKSGQKFADYLNINDYLFDVDNKSITNRPDLWSHFGIAREISVFLDLKLKTPPLESLDKASKEDEEKFLSVKIEDKKLCPRYMAAILTGVKVEQSPQWLQERLVAVGVRPINNIVDITNYVMLELGQPLHAFDYNKIQDYIVVRNAKENENIITLDGEKRTLSKDVLVIADKKKPIAIAGVMGALNSEIDDNSTVVVLEAANFNFASIRKTAQRFSLRTEASIRFEKSLDPFLCETALARAVYLIKKICPQARLARKTIDKQNFSQAAKKIKLNLSWLNKFIGTNINKKRVILILEKLGFIINEEKDDILQVVIPSWRATKDISSREDLAEEIARIYGYENITPILPQVDLSLPIKNKEIAINRHIRNMLSFGASLSEVDNYSFVGEELLKKLDIDHINHLKIINPIAEQHSLLRQSLAPNMFLNVKTNQARFDNVWLYEIGNVFLPLEGQYFLNTTLDDRLPLQELRLGILIAANSEDFAYNKVKGIIEYLFAGFKLNPMYEPTENTPPWAKQSYGVMVKIDKEIIGSINLLSVDKQKKMGIKKFTAIGELSLPLLYKILEITPPATYKEPSKYPPIYRDLAFVVSEKILYNDLKKEINDFHHYINDVKLFDVYHGNKLGQDKKSLAFHITYQADRTLTAAEIDKIQKNLADYLAKKYEAKIRDF